MFAEGHADDSDYKATLERLKKASGGQLVSTETAEKWVARQEVCVEVVYQRALELACTACVRVLKVLDQW